MNETGKVFVACSTGAFIGTLIANQMSPYFWWVGMLVGGLVGYLSYDLSVVMHAVPKAWKKAKDPNLDILKNTGHNMLIAAYFVLWIGLAVLPALCAIAYAPVLEKTGLGLSMLGLTSFTSMICPYLTIIMIMEPGNGMLNELRTVTIRYNIFAILLWHLPLTLFKLTKWLIGVLPQFAKNLFILIHSKERLVCLTDAAIGAAVGHLCYGNPLVGALAGGIIGVLDYEIISKRLLKVVPVRIKN